MVDLKYLRAAVNGRDFDYKVCAGLLEALAEVERLRDGLAFEQVQTRALRDALTRTQADSTQVVSNLRARLERQGAALPDAESLEHLLNLARFRERQAVIHCEKIAELDAEVERLRAELAAALGREKQLSQLLSEYESRDIVKIAAETEIALGDMQARAKALEAALPKAELLEVAATMLRYFGNSLGQTESGQLIHVDAENLRAAAARIREAQA